MQFCLPTSKALAITIIVSSAAWSAAVYSQGTSTPEELLDTRQELMMQVCDLECSRKVASLYSQQFLQLIKDSLVTTLSTTSDRANDAQILFGKDIEQEELEKMSPVDIFALQLLHRNHSIPFEYRYSKTEILSKEFTSPDEVKLVVRNSGLPSEPGMSEEEIVHLVKEGGEWKLRN